MGVAQHVPDRGRSPAGGTGKSAEVLAGAVRDVLRDTSASAVAVELPLPGTMLLRAVVMAVNGTGMGAVEEIPLDEEFFPSAKAFRTGELAIGDSDSVLERHPNLSVLTPFSYRIVAAPIRAGATVLGTMSVYWADNRSGDTEPLIRACRNLGAILDRDPGGGAPALPRIPLVVSPDVHGAPDTTTPLLFHLHKLAMLLNDAADTRSAVALAIERVISGFGAAAVAIALTDADRLVVAGSFGCTREYLKLLSGARLSMAFPEAEAINRTQHTVYGPHDPRTRGRCAEDDAGFGEDGADGEEGAGPCSWVVLPLVAGGRAVGTCSLALGSSARHLVEEQSSLAALSSMLGHTLERTRLDESRYSLVQRLQEALLPRSLPQPAGLVSVSRYRPAVEGIELGGDWYDLIELPSGELAMVIGDVEGHNAEAVVIMGQLRSAVRAYAAEGHGPAAVLARTNRLLMGLRADVFATCCCVWLDPETGTVRVATAGHPLPLVRTAAGEYLEASLEAGPPLGITGDAAFTTGILSLEPGTVLALYTDGLSGSTGEIAPEAFEAALSAAGPELESLADRILEGPAEFPVRSADDAALLLVRYEGTPGLVQENLHELELHRRDLRGVQRARRFLRGWLSAWDLASVTDVSELLMSEVVTNGLVHGDSDVSVCVRKYPGYVRVEVRDSDPRPAQAVTMPRAEDQEEGGRGLLIVTALASTWGNSPAGRGKTVWFELPTDPSEPLAVAPGP